MRRRTEAEAHRTFSGTELPIAYGLKVCCRTTLPPCTIVISAVANWTSVRLVAQFEFGQPASAAVGAGGGVVVTQALRFPFLIWVDGMVACPLGLTGVLFWPGAVLPPWLVQRVV